MRGSDLSIAIGFLLVFLGALSHAAPPPVEFSADAFQTTPQGQKMEQRMYVGAEGRVRVESSTAGQEFIQIIDPTKKAMFMLMPEQKAYMAREFEGTDQLERSTVDPDNPNPCAGVPDATCKLLGKETVNGRSAEKWELVQEQGGETQRMLYWIDVERRLPLRQFMPDGTTTELKQVGTEVLNGRQTEKWQMTVAQAGGEAMESFQWYDPQLKIAIREELPGGAYRELRNIQIGKQSASLFQIPGDYRKISVPQSPQGSQSPQGMPPHGEGR
jgi:hypothetical protein